MGVGRRALRWPAGRFSHRTAARRGEVRLPAATAVVAAAALYAALPHTLLVEPRWVIPVVELALLVPLTLINPTRMTSETRWSRIVSLVLVAVIVITNTVSLGYLLRDLTSAPSTNGRTLLLAALQVWLTNIIAFALAYWELDRGGAVARLPTSGVPAGRADFLFPQDDPAIARLATGEPPDAPDAPWVPTFLDYLYLSITNSTAFSPTDTMPLSSRAKTLMGLQGLAALVTSLLVIARAVNILR